VDKSLVKEPRPGEGDHYFIFLSFAFHRFVIFLSKKVSLRSLDS